MQPVQNDQNFHIIPNTIPLSLVVISSVYLRPGYLLIYLTAISTPSNIIQLKHNFYGC